MNIGNNTTIIGAFGDLNSARMTVDELTMAGFDRDEVRLTENDQNGQVGDEAKFGQDVGGMGGSTMTSDASLRTGAPAGDTPNEGTHKGFFARLFGLDEDYKEPIDDRWSTLNNDSDSYFHNAYQSRQHLVIVTCDATDAAEASMIMRRNGAQIDEKASTAFHSHADQVRTMRLNAEELVARKFEVETGGVSVRKEIVTETKTIEVPVTREEIVVERHPITDGREVAASSLDTGNLRPGEEIRITTKEERVDIDKRVVPVEEVTVGKRTLHEKQVVSEQVKREEARIDRETTPRARPARGIDRDDRPSV